MRKCIYCQEILVKKENEDNWGFKQRKFCGKECSNRNRKGKPGNLSEEGRKRISEANKGKIVSEETRKKLSLVNKGRKRSKETRARISAAGIGRKQSKETIAKRSIAMKGKKHSLKTCIKISLTKLKNRSLKELKYPKEITGYNLIDKQKEIIKNRDGNECVFCRGKETTQLCVHHIDGNKKNDDPNNLVTICNSCHTKLHRKK